MNFFFFYKNNIDGEAVEQFADFRIFLIMNTGTCFQHGHQNTDDRIRESKSVSTRLKPIGLCLGRGEIIVKTNITE